MRPCCASLRSSYHIIAHKIIFHSVWRPVGAVCPAQRRTGGANRQTAAHTISNFVMGQVRAPGRVVAAGHAERRSSALDGADSAGPHCRDVASPSCSYHIRFPLVVHAGGCGPACRLPSGGCRQDLVTDGQTTAAFSGLRQMPGRCLDRRRTPGICNGHRLGGPGIRGQHADTRHFPVPPRSRLRITRTARSCLTRPCVDASRRPDLPQQQTRFTR
jgi:hypothetical protein